MAKKPKDPPTEKKPGRGRRPGNPAAKRTYRFVMRMHPDLAETLNWLADEAGLSRSLFVEHVLLKYLSLDPRIHLDHIGRKVQPESVPQNDHSFAAIGRKWQAFQAMHYEMFGDTPNSGRQAWQGKLGDHGRDPPPASKLKRSHPKKSTSAEHGTSEGPGPRVFPHRGGRRK